MRGREQRRTFTATCRAGLAGAALLLFAVRAAAGAATPEATASPTPSPSPVAAAPSPVAMPVMSPAPSPLATASPTTTAPTPSAAASPSPAAEQARRLAARLETETAPEALLATIEELRRLGDPAAAEPLANVINGYKMDGRRRVPLASLARLAADQRAEIQRRAVECFRELRPIADPRARLTVMFAILSWIHEQPDPDGTKWSSTSAIIRHVVSRDGEPYADWKFDEWRTWYNNRVREEMFRAQLESLKTQALKAATEGDAARARQYYEQYISVWQQIIESADPRVAEPDPNGLSQIQQEATDAMSDLQARLGLE